MPEPIVVPPLVSATVTAALTKRHEMGGVRGMTRTAAITALELATSPVTAPEVVRRVAAWHEANPHHTTPDGRSTPLAGIWGGRAGRDWALAMTAAIAEPAAPTGPVAAGIFVIAADTGRVLLLQRALSEDDPNGGKWEAPGGKLDPGEGTLEAARREFAEEARIEVPGRLVGDFVSPNGVYHGFVYLVDVEAEVVLNVDHEDRAVHNPDDPDGDGCEVIAWWGIDDADGNPVLRDEVRESTPWEMFRGLLPAAKAASLPATSTCEYCSQPATKALLHAEGMAYVPVCDSHEAKGKAAIGDDELSGVRPFTGSISDPLDIIREIPGSKTDKRQKLKRLSKRLASIDTRTRYKLHAGAEVAMADGLRRAGVKVTQRARKGSKAVQASVVAAAGAYGPAVLAAVGITEQEALAHAFEGYGVKAQKWMSAADAERVVALRDELDLDDVEVAELGTRYDASRAVAIGFLVAGLGAVASRMLSDPHPHVDGPGEVASSDVPLGIIAETLAIADGRPTAGPGNEGVGPLGEGEITVDRFGGGITFDVVAGAVDGVVEQLAWTWGGSERPFEPHQRLDGTTTTADAMETDWVNNDDFPDSPYLYPGDHIGCACWIDSAFAIPIEAEVDV